MKPLLIAKGLSKSFTYPVHNTILNGIDLIVMPGESVAIVGRSGEGKSTLLQILGTLEQPCQGTLKIGDEFVSIHNKNRIRNSSIGFVFQSFHLLEDYTALENVLMPASIARQKISRGSDAHNRAMYLLAKVGLADRAHFQTKVLSGGEKQRVSLARAMANDPSILFADEPSGNLDRQTAEVIHEIMFDFVHINNKALILVTHDRELASHVSTQYELQNCILNKI